MRHLLSGRDAKLGILHLANNPHISTHSFMNSRIIRVQGKGSVSQSPDCIQISMEISELRKEFDLAVEHCNRRTDSIRSVLKEIGVEPAELKTSSFKITEEYDYQKDRKVHVGFLASHRTNLKIGNDKVLLGRILNAVLRGADKPILKISYKISDSGKFREKLLIAAVENATIRAKTIAHASSVELGRILQVEHGAVAFEGSIQLAEFSADENYFQRDAPTDWNFEAQDIESEASVTITWAMKD